MKSQNDTYCIFLNRVLETDLKTFRKFRNGNVSSMNSSIKSCFALTVGQDQHGTFLGSDEQVTTGHYATSIR